jgi:hypothetical protein
LTARCRMCLRGCVNVREKMGCMCGVVGSTGARTFRMWVVGNPIYVVNPLIGSSLQSLNSPVVVGCCQQCGVHPANITIVQTTPHLSINPPLFGRSKFEPPSPSSPRVTQLAKVTLEVCDDANSRPLCSTYPPHCIHTARHHFCTAAAPIPFKSHWKFLVGMMDCNSGWSCALCFLHIGLPCGTHPCT